MFSNDLKFTLLALCVCAALGTISFKRHFAKHDKLKPRMVPWMLICLACVSTGVMIVVHLVNLMGFETGR